MKMLTLASGLAGTKGESGRMGETWEKPSIFINKRNKSAIYLHRSSLISTSSPEEENPT
jgi:hypothetical protein